MYEVTMPKLSDSMETGQIIEWKVKEGDAVHEGDVLADVESDKATMELECFADGVVAKILHGNDTEVAVGEIIAYIAAEGEGAGAAAKPAAEAPPAPPAEEKPAPKPVAKAGPAPPPAPAPAPSAPARGPGLAPVSPYARRLAEQKGIDLATIAGSGPGGRIIARDVEAAAAGKAPAPEPTAPPAAPEAAEAAAPPPAAKKPRELRKEIDIDPTALTLAQKHGVDAATLEGTGTNGRITVDDVLSAARAIPAVLPPAPDDELPSIDFDPDEADVADAPFRFRTQARRVTASKHVIPHFYITRGADVAKLLARKDEVKEKFGATVTHFVQRACVEAIKQHPHVNRSYDRGRIITWKGIHLGIAVDTDRGLTVVVLRDAQKLALEDIAKQTMALVEKARSGKLSAAERSHPTFTVTNLGMFDVEHFQPIINPPSAITIGVSTALPTPVVRDDRICITRLMRVTLSCDHRIVEGATAARFLKTLKELLEDPAALLGPPEDEEQTP